MVLTINLINTNPLFTVPLLLVHQVHVDSEGDVLHHDQAVRHSNASQDEVDGVGPHVLVCEHSQVQHVEDCPKHADCQG